MGTASSKRESSSSSPSSVAEGLDSDRGGEGVAERWAGERDEVDEEDEDEEGPSTHDHIPEDTLDPGDMDSPVRPEGNTEGDSAG
ncbi:hypothetical protein Pmani_029422 [Petrolisthes manimaculis]|uniref:Uncharacterized protein n=1 Tax=Petrolisthes manimaculis TaxID=1843537 RepID=A0AAE1P015_9EUCA|nr:hypothetical protein Pmani_029422 [Petrolisthes manimaculis]